METPLALVLPFETAAAAYARCIGYEPKGKLVSRCITVSRVSTCTGGTPGTTQTHTYLRDTSSRQGTSAHS